MGDWGDESMTRLRVALYERDGAAGLALLKTRPLSPVLQYAGDLLRHAVAQGVPGADSYARRCVEELRARDEPGDEDLARELENGRADLIDVPVDLDELGFLLTGEPAAGAHVVDLRDGHVLPAEALAAEAEPAYDETSEQYDPERWLTFWPEGRDARGETARAERARGRARAWLAAAGYRANRPRL